MPNVLENRRPLWSALFTGTGFAILMLALQITDSPLRILLAALAMAVLAGMTTYRQQQGKPLLPTSVLVLLGGGALALYTWTFLVGDRPSGAEWIAVALVFLFPLLVLYVAYDQWRARQ